MATRKRSTDTIAALLSSAPAPTPMTDDEQSNSEALSVGLPTANTTPVALRDDEQVIEATAELVPHLTPVGPAQPIGPTRDEPVGLVAPTDLPTTPNIGSSDDTGEWAEPDELEAFDFDASAPLVRPRRRKQPDYQTVRLHRTTAQIMRQAWLASRKTDAAITYTEFSTLVCQHGLRALKEARERGD